MRQIILSISTIPTCRQHFYYFFFSSHLLDLFYLIFIQIAVAILYGGLPIIVGLHLLIYWAVWFVFVCGHCDVVHFYWIWLNFEQQGPTSEKKISRSALMLNFTSRLLFYMRKLTSFRPLTKLHNLSDIKWIGNTFTCTNTHTEQSLWKVEWHRNSSRLLV